MPFTLERITTRKRWAKNAAAFNNEMMAIPNKIAENTNDAVWVAGLPGAGVAVGIGYVESTVHDVTEEVGGAEKEVDDATRAERAGRAIAAIFWTYLAVVVVEGREGARWTG